MAQGIAEFTESQIAQLVEYLRFEEQKRREMRTEISGEISDLFTQKIQKSEIYSGKDGLEQLAALPDQLDKTVESELERNRDIGIVLINHIFQQAQDTGIRLEISVPDLGNEKMTDEANKLCGQLLANGDKYKEAARAKSSASQNPKGAEKIDHEEPKEEPKSEINIEELKAENERLRKQLKMNKREWPEFKAAVQELKDRNTEIHKIREQLGE